MTEHVDTWKGKYGVMVDVGAVRRTGPLHENVAYFTLPEAETHAMVVLQKEVFPVVKAIALNNKEKIQTDGNKVWLLDIVKTRAPVGAYLLQRLLELVQADKDLRGLVIDEDALFVQFKKGKE